MAPRLPTTVKTLIHNTAEKKLYLTTQPTPTPDFSQDEHLIKVHATAPCSGELLWPINFPEFCVQSPTPIPCFDVAGTVVSAPPSSPFQTGARVWGRTSPARHGMATEYAIATTSELAIVPDNLTWEEAATVPLSALTAWEALFEQSKIGHIESGAWKGKRLLITAASGGVGLWAVQLAKLAGAIVVGTCGPSNVEFVKSLGAEDVVNYRDQSLKHWVEDDRGQREVDIVFDCIGGKSLKDAWWTVKDGGELIGIYEPTEGQRPEELKGKTVRNLFFVMKPIGAPLKEIGKFIESGKLKPALDSTWPFDDYQKAFDKVASGHARGKVVIKIAE
ncbi:putative zinc-binding oxidoreductase [Aulographum hederae CBS 113979]|uniref:Putative zinc-binding oxidoreductase n=1 Tax=Aulographum hederae CBS 113979 TaxID=1176131 RepID=A0A6G1HE67_9PEZI|nr:putative zinc-binding oxidoreductase [Aulographum hederae CBS 113979]